jgi:hypothetical protein
MRTITTLFAFAGSLLLLQKAAAQGTERPLDDFTAIKLNKAYNIILSQGASCSIKMEGDDKAAGKVKAEVKDNTLKISNEEDYMNAEQLKIYVTVKDLSKIELSGASDIKSAGNLNVDKLTINASGAGDINLQLTANEVTAEASGAGDITLSGTANVLNARVSGAGDLKAFKLEAKKAIVKTSGAGDAKINVLESLTADVSGNGNIIYKGEPADRQVEINGFGSVRQSNTDSDVDVITPYDKPTAKSDTTRFRIGGNRVIIIDDNDTIIANRNKKKKHDKVKDIWGGVELGVNGYMTSDNKVNMPGNYDFMELNYGKSLNLNLNLFEKHIRLYHNYVAVTTGLGFEFNRYMFQNNITLDPNGNTLLATYNNYGFQKNCLKASYVTVPLLLEFNSNKNAKKSFHFAFGLVGEYLLASKTKQIFEIDGHTYKSKVRDDYNLNPFKYSPTVRLGYGRFNVFATYALSPLFEQSAIAPKLYPFTIGIGMAGI